MKSVGVRLENLSRYRTQASLAVDDIIVLIGKNDAGRSSILDALAIFFDEQSVCSATGPVFTANGNRNVPPERDVEPVILSLAELSDSIQRRGRAMQPYGRLRNLARTTHVS